MNEQILTEADIDLEALTAGDKQVFAQVVDLYADRLYNLALKLTGHEQDAEDVLQEAFINAYKKGAAKSAPGCIASPTTQP